MTLNHVYSLALALLAIYLWAALIKVFSDLVFRAKTGSLKKSGSGNKRLLAKAEKLIQEDLRVKKVYVSLRVLHLKNKKSHKVELLEQQLRYLVRDKALRQEILFLVRKNSAKSSKR